MNELQESKNILEQAKSLGVTGSGVDALSGVINSETLAGGEKAVTVPDTPTSTAGAGLSAFASSVGEQEKERAKLQAEEDAKVAEAQVGAKEEKGKLQSLMDKILGVQEKQATLEEEAGIAGKAERVTTHTNQLEALERAEVNELRALEGQGLTPIQKQQRQSELTRRYAFQKADVALLQSAANRDLETAQNIINRKIELTLEPLKQQLEFTKFFYEDNKKDLDKAEQRAFDLKIGELDRKYEETKVLEKYKGDIALEGVKNGVPIPSYVQAEINRAGSQAEVNQILARNGISLQDPLDRALKLSQIAESRAKAEQARGALPPAIQTRVQGIAGQFDAEQAVKAYQTSAEAIDAVKNSGITPTDDIGRIYAFAKVMDPNSVVREGEYATVQKYATAVLQRYGLEAKRVFTNSGFLTDEARKFLLTTLENRLASSKKAVDNIYSEYGRRIDKVTGRTDGTDYITDYGKAFDSPGDTTKTTQSGKPFDYQGALNSGYTEEEIQEYLDSH